MYLTYLIMVQLLVGQVGKLHLVAACTLARVGFGLVKLGLFLCWCAGTSIFGSFGTGEAKHRTLSLLGGWKECRAACCASTVTGTSTGLADAGLADVGLAVDTNFGLGVGSRFSQSLALVHTAVRLADAGLAVDTNFGPGVGSRFSQSLTLVHTRAVLAVGSTRDLGLATSLARVDSDDRVFVTVRVFKTAFQLKIVLVVIVVVRNDSVAIAQNLTTATTKTTTLARATPKGPPAPQGGPLWAG